MPPKKFHHEILTSDEFTDPLRFRIFFYLVMKARDRAGKYRGVKIRRGEVVTGRGDIARATGISEGAVRGKIKLMCEDETISVRSEGVQGARFGVITITNYEEYQCKGDNQDKKPTVYTNNKRLLSANPYSAEFLKWWPYLKTGSKKEAWYEWQIATDIPPVDELITKTKDYINHCNVTERQLKDACRFIKYSLHDQDWNKSKVQGMTQGEKKITQYTERDRMKDWIAGSPQFMKWHGMSIQEYSDQVSRDLCDISDDDFWKKYGVMKSTAREIKES